MHVHTCAVAYNLCYSLFLNWVQISSEMCTVFFHIQSTLQPLFVGYCTDLDPEYDYYSQTVDMYCSYHTLWLSLYI